MDHSYDGAYSRTQNIPTGRLLEERTSAELRAPQTTPKLQKKRSNNGLRGLSQPVSNIAGQSAGTQDPRRMGEEGQTRRGSIRNAMRRIFGRKSREPESQPRPQQSSPTRREHYYSEPRTGVTTQPNIPEDPPQEDVVAQRVLSAPFSIMPSMAFQRNRSPYAVEFPQSARLKPIDLGDPFSAPGSQLRRRKTLPSVLIAESDAAALASSIATEGAASEIKSDEGRKAPTPNKAKGRLSSRSQKRKSRSAEELKRNLSQTQSSPRKRSEEIQYWRDSFQGSVLRASGFRARSPTGLATNQRDDDTTPMPSTHDPFDSRAGPSLTTPQRQRERGMSERDIGSPSAFGTELSADLEDRVARLEAGLLNFRGQLDKLALDRNRRTVLTGDIPLTGSRRRRASSGERTASMLATDLQSDLGPSNYQYEYTRPSTSPQPPRTPVRSDPSFAAPYLTARQGGLDDPFTSPSVPPVPSTPAANYNDTNPSVLPQHTFRSLYEMLNDERSARRKLENKMKGLQQDIANLHYQVSLQSNVQSQRSSYYASMNPMVGSSRLHDFLRDTETSPPSAAQRQAARLSGEQAGMVSRFSGSESASAGGAESEDIQTPYDAYQTPLEERTRPPFNERPRTEGSMF